VIILSVKDINTKEFENEVLKAKSPVLVDFWAEWCGPCRVFSPIIDDLSKEYDSKAKFYKLNVDDNPEVAERYNVMSIPTAILFEKGEVKAITIGAIPKENLKSWLNSNI
jgi:thioredoxin